MKITRLSPPADVRAQLATETRDGLSADAKSLPTRFLYDGRGSELFEQITQQPEYYPTRQELSLLERTAESLVGDSQPEEIVELGSGSSRKTCVLLEAMHHARSGHTYAPLDISEDALLEAEARLTRLYPWLTVTGSVGNFEDDIPNLPRHGRRMVAFLGSTLGNLAPEEGSALLNNVQDSLEDGDHFLLGVDTTQDPEIVEAAYNDAAGVTAAFSLNLLSVINQELGADFDETGFEHVARWVPERTSIETFLRVRSAGVVTIPTLEREFALEKGEEIFIERSRKFSQEALGEMAHAAGLKVARWELCDRGRMSLALLVAA